MRHAATRPDRPPTSGPVTLSAGSIAIRDEAAFGTDSGEACARFLARAFAVAEVRSATVDRVEGTIRIRHDAAPAALAGLIGRIVAALRAPSEASPPVPLPALTSAPRFSLHRHGATLTSWEVILDQPGRLKLRQGALRNAPVVVNRVVGELLKLPGVRVVKASERTGFLLVRYDPAAISARALLGRAEATLFEIQLAASKGSAGVLAGFRVANASLAVAALGEFLVPWLLPASAILLVATNFKTFRSAVAQLRARRLGLPVLYIAIIATTLATGNSWPRPR